MQELFLRKISNPRCEHFLFCRILDLFIDDNKENDGEKRCGQGPSDGIDRCKGLDSPEDS